MHPQSANRNPVTCCKDGFTGYSRSQKVSAIRHLFSAHGVVVLLATTPTGQPSTSGKLSKATFDAHFPMLYSQSQIGPRKEDFSDLSGMFLLETGYSKTKSGQDV